MIMALRDHVVREGAVLLADEGKREGLLEGNDTLTKEAERPLVGDTGDDWFYMPESGAGVIDPDVLWSCVTCGACVQQCPVDIEHVDHIVDMRRYQVLVESNFPAELNQLFKGMENKGNPWNMSPTARMDWAKGLDFDVKVVGEDIESLDEVEWLFWVGCAGAYEDRAKKTTRAVAELLDMAGVSFGVLGNGETCTGDSARRAGNEFVFQGLAAAERRDVQGVQGQEGRLDLRPLLQHPQERVQGLRHRARGRPPHAAAQPAGARGQADPGRADGAGAAPRSITYHDPCYIGRHNGVYSPPRELLEVLPGAEFIEMPRNSERSFCCGAGGARMWMEETIGTRINENRTAEAVGTGADQIAVGCPFCRVMLSDGLTAAAGQGRGPRGGRGPRRRADAARLGEGRVRRPKAKAGASAAAAPAAQEVRGDQGRARAGRPTQTEETVTDTEDVGPAAKASGGSSLFDIGADEPEAERPEAKQAEPGEAKSSGGSLFDIGGDEPEAEGRGGEPKPTPAEPARPSVRRLALRHRRRRARGQEEPEPTPAEPVETRVVRGSLFDIERPSPRRAGTGALAGRARRGQAARRIRSSTSKRPSRRPKQRTGARRRSSLSRPKAEPTTEQPAAEIPAGRLPLRHRRPRARNRRRAEPEPEPVEPRARPRTRPRTSRLRASARAPPSARRRPSPPADDASPEPTASPNPRGRAVETRRPRTPTRPPRPTRSPSRAKPGRRSRRRSRSRPAAARLTSRRPTSTSTSRARSSTSDGAVRDPPPSYRGRRTGAGMDFQEYVAARRTSLVRAAVLLGAAEVAAPRSSATTLLREAARIERTGRSRPASSSPRWSAAARAESARLPVGRRARPRRTPHARRDGPRPAGGRGARVPCRPDPARDAPRARPRGGRSRRRRRSPRASDLGVPTTARRRGT